MELTVEPTAPSYFEHRSHSRAIWRTPGRSAILAEFHRSIPLQASDSPGTIALAAGFPWHLSSESSMTMICGRICLLSTTISHNQSYGDKATELSVRTGDVA